MSEQGGRTTVLIIEIAGIMRFMNVDHSEMQLAFCRKGAILVT
jgi:hypothetical protein